jgi:hypothetical protein
LTELISAIHGNYDFLTKLYLNESDVIETPSRGMAGYYNLNYARLRQDR